MKKTFGRVLALLLCALLLCAGLPALAALAEQKTDPAAAATEDPITAPAGTDKASPTDPQPAAPACEATGEHVFEAYRPGENGTHTAVCTLCGKTFEFPCEAAADAVYTPDGEGGHSTVCAVCGGTLAGECVYADPAEWTDQGDGTHGTVCTVCGGLKTEACVYEDAVTLPTATEGGYTTHTCTVCGASYQDQETAAENERLESALPGDLNRDGTVGSDDARTLLRVSVSLEALTGDMLPYGDIDRDGEITSADARTVLRGSVGLEPVPDRHDYTAAVVKEPTCTKTGMLTYACAYCGLKGEMAIPAKGHRYETTKTKEPTCTADGTRFERCAVCGETRSVALRAKGHVYEMTASAAATCTAPGSETFTCTVCGDVKKNELPALGHDWVEAVPGKAKHCARCGEIVVGWTEIDGVSYYFKEDGTPLTGKLFMDGLLFTFSSTGASETGRTGKKPKVAVIGDSIVASIAAYDVADDFDMYGKISLHVDTIDTKTISGSSRTVLHEVEGRGYDVVILMIGVNDLTYDNTWWGNHYREVLRQLKTLAPGAIIYASAIMPINDSKTGADEKMWMVTAKNKVIKEAADAEGVRFLGTPPGLLNSNGQLPYDAASDGIHFGPTYCRIWYDWTKAQLK